MSKPIKPGYYRLSRDVTNPHPDKRKTREITAAPVWKAGTRIAIQQVREHMLPKTCAGRAVLELEFADAPYSSLTRRYEWDDVFKALKPALEPIEPDLDLTLHKVGHKGYHILDRLVRAGRVTLAQVEEAGREIDAEYAEEREAKA